MDTGEILPFAEWVRSGRAVTAPRRAQPPHRDRLRLDNIKNGLSGRGTLVG
jgi:hypothetical protein